MDPKRFSVEHALYTLVLVLALSVRLINLGAMPLSDFEAVPALHALEIAGKEELGSFGEGDFNQQPLYRSLTAILFYVFQSTNFTARFWPAILGGSLVLVPFLLRDLIGRKSALLLAFALALDPGLVAMSRFAGNQMLAVCFTAWALAFFYIRKPVGVGISSGMALLSSPVALQGLLALVSTWGVIRILARDRNASTFTDQGFSPERKSSEPGNWWVSVIVAAATLIVVSTLFLWYPRGLSAWAGTIPSFFQSWITPSGVPALTLVIALLVYQPLGSIFALVGAIRSWFRGDTVSQGLAIWCLVSLVLVLIYPARQVGDLLWVLLPLWSLAARELSRYLVWDPDGGWISLAQAFFVLVLMALVWLNITGVGLLALDVQNTALRLGVIVGVFGLGIVATILVAYGWTREIAIRGFVWGICAAMGLYSLSAMWGLSQIHTGQRVELWYPYPLTVENELLLTSIADSSEWYTGDTDSLDIFAPNSIPSLSWALRDFTQVEFISEYQAFPGGEQPGIVITVQDQEAPALAAAYRGQDFVWRMNPAWTSKLPPDFITWVVFRQAPMQLDKVVLWARVDLFPEGFILSETEAD